MAVEGRQVTFARYMDVALTHPVDGYYSNADRLLGAHGHFSTAPHLCSAFNQAVLRLLTELVDESLATMPWVSGPAVVELGGGEGDLARAILDGWHAARPDLLDKVMYAIVEMGEGLRARQREALSHLTEQGCIVSWADTIADAPGDRMPAVILGNEFVDALPIHRVDVRGAEPVEAWVVLEDIGGVWHIRETWDHLSPEAERELRLIFGTTETTRLRSLSKDGFIELRPAAGTLLAEASSAMAAGSLLTVDYGGWFMGPEDCCGGGGGLYARTLRGYFRHQATNDPYLRVGRQDLTSDVDFRALDIHGRAVGFETILFTTLATLLRADGAEQTLVGLEDQVGRGGDGSLDADKEATVLRALLEEEGLGGAFKVMLQVKE